MPELQGVDQPGTYGTPIADHRGRSRAHSWPDPVYDTRGTNTTAGSLCPTGTLGTCSPAPPGHTPEGNADYTTGRTAGGQGADATAANTPDHGNGGLCGHCG